MSSEPNLAAIENASEGEVELAQIQGGGSLPRSSMSATVEPVQQSAESRLHDSDIAQEQRLTKDDALHAPPQKYTKPGTERSPNWHSDLPNPEDGILKPEGDPFEYLLKPMLEKDTIRCNAWKDEVQNILIFAGLFSAVVTAFIIESYQRLQPDSTDIMIGLLALIADRLDNAPNRTETVSSIIANTGFEPSRTDVNINIFWFISLVLSLTVALIGIVILQWLREHQRYDYTPPLKPQEIMAILNARLDSFKRWYVPQIFAGLPLLLQAALVLFFAGMIEFLFALHLDVAVPVTLAISIPLIFLIGTTILPLLQVCILRDAFRLSINDNVPSSCPYKSPQSLIARRFGLAYYNGFTFFAAIVASAYYYGVVKVVCAIHTLRGRRGRMPLFHHGSSNLRARLQDDFPSGICDIRQKSDDWVSMDTVWLHVRTTYALSLQLQHRDGDDLVTPRSGYWPYDTRLPELYDCTIVLNTILHQHQHRPNADSFGAVYGCLSTLCSQALSSFQNISRWPANGSQILVTDLCLAFGQILAPLGVYEQLYRCGVAFIEDVICHESADNSGTASKTLTIAYMTHWLIFTHPDQSTTRREQLCAQIFKSRSGISPERLFPMSSADEWLPVAVSLDVFGFCLKTEDTLGHIIHQQLLAFFEGCSTMKPNPRLLFPDDSTNFRNSYKAVSEYMLFMTLLDCCKEDTFAHLVAQLCHSNGPQNFIQEKPFLLIAACFFLDGAAGWAKQNRNNSLPLLKLILQNCGTTEGKFSRGRLGGPYKWTGLHDAIKAIHNHHNPTHHSTNNADSSISLFTPNSSDSNV